LRIVLLTSSYPRFPGDSSAPFVKSIAEGIARHGHDVEVVVPYDAEIRKVETNNVHINRFRYIWPTQFHIVGHARSLFADVKLRLPAIGLMPFFLVAAFFKLMEVTKKQKSQVIYVHWVLPNGLIAAWVAAIRRIPFVISIHGSDMYVAQQNWLFRSIASSIFKRAAAVTACSPELRQAAIALNAPKDTLLLAYGADPALFHPSLKLLEDRHSFGWDQSELIIATIGRMVYKKGFNFLIEAVPEIIKRYPQVRLVVGGDGPLRRELAAQAEKLGVSKHVSFTGRIPWDHLQEFLSSSDIFILPSVKDKFGNMDGLPTVLLEAMSCGIPIIASKIGGVVMVVENGRTGLIVPPGDPHALAEAICSLAGDPDKRQAIGKAARQAIEQQFNWNNVVIKLIDLLEQAIRM
jgi:glycosyltransferase involved in cell wall biosynthesis